MFNCPNSIIGKLKRLKKKESLLNKIKKYATVYYY